MATRVDYGDSYRDDTSAISHSLSSPDGYNTHDVLQRQLDLQRTGSTLADQSQINSHASNDGPMLGSSAGFPQRQRVESVSEYGDVVEGNGHHQGSRTVVDESEYSVDDDPRGAMIMRQTDVPPEDDEQQADPNEYVEDVVQPGFDETILRALCDMDGGVPLLLDRIKQSMTSCREAATFLKKRAALEDDFGRGLSKLSRQTSEIYAVSDGKAGTFVGAWHSAMKIHEIIGDNRVKFASRMNEMSEELTMLMKEVDKNRKGTKDLAARYERTLQESEAALEKARTRHDQAAEELQRFLLSKEGESSKDAGMSASGGKSNKRNLGKTIAKGGMLLKGRNPASMARQEDDIRSRVSQAAELFRKSVEDTQTLRQEYFNFQLPRTLRALKECADEIDMGLQYHLSRYAFLLESTALSDGSAITPAGIEDGPGIKLVIGSIDNQHDFKVYMQNYAVAHMPKAPKREGPWEQGFLPPLPNHYAPPSQQSFDSSPSGPTLGAAHIKQQGQPYSNSSHNGHSPIPSPSDQLSASQVSHQQLDLSQSQVSRVSGETRNPSVRQRGPIFGVDLAEQMTRDHVELPPILEKCCTAIRDGGGLDHRGIYRVSAVASQVTKLRNTLDRDVDAVDLMSPEWSSDINLIPAVLKLWLRDLPEPLLTFSLYRGFIDAANESDVRLRHIRLHERVNELPDPNYATLKYLMAHLNDVSENHQRNQMNVSNLAIVFGPNLLRAESGAMNDINAGTRAVEIILDHYRDIFVDESASSTQP